MLKGKMIINTRPDGSKDRIGEALKEGGATVLAMPLIEINPLPIPEKIKGLLAAQAYQWLVFTSKNGVDHFFNQLEPALLTSNPTIKMAVFGKRTAMTLEKWGLKAEVVNFQNTSADLLDDLLPKLLPDDQVLLVLGDLASPLLEEGIKTKARVERLNVYHTGFVAQSDHKIMERIRLNDYDLLLFTSPSGFKSFMHHLPQEIKPSELRIACLGPTTEAAIAEEGLVPLIVAKPSGKVGLIKGIEQYFSGLKHA